MKLFVWRSEAIKNYASGHLIALAETDDEAREKVRTAAASWLVENREWIVMPDGTPDPFYQEDFDDFMHTLDRDLAKEPTVVEGDAMLISGSE